MRRGNLVFIQGKTLRDCFASLAMTALWLILLVTASFAAQNQHIQEKLAVLEAISGKFSFVVIGDNRTGNEQYKKLVSMIVERKPDIVLRIREI